MHPAPPLTVLSDLQHQLNSTGWAVLPASGLAALAGLQTADMQTWLPVWDALPDDPHLRDGGRYRQRRHGCCVVQGGSVQSVPHRPHWQPVEYNALHGGFERWFDPLPSSLQGNVHWQHMLGALGGVADQLRGQAVGAAPWFVEAHPFRINTQGGIGRPTPEGAHRDGVDLVAVVLVARHNVKGGETRVFDARGPQGVRFTLDEPFSVLLLDDERVIHETTPIQPKEADQPAWRDTLVLTYRAGGFQGPAAT
jgi:hypothetical protein